MTTRIKRTVTISSGSAVSDAEEDLRGYVLAAIVMPSAWTNANLTLQAIAEPGGTYQDVYDDGGTEYSLTVDASQFVALEQDARERFRAAYGVKLRSGTGGTPVNQAADREIVLVFVGD